MNELDKKQQLKDNIQKIIWDNVKYESSDYSDFNDCPNEILELINNTFKTNILSYLEQYKINLEKGLLKEKCKDCLSIIDNGISFLDLILKHIKNKKFD